MHQILFFSLLPKLLILKFTFTLLLLLILLMLRSKEALKMECFGIKVGAQFSWELISILEDFCLEFCLLAVVQQACNHNLVIWG